MSAELDAKIDALRERLITDAQTPIGMGNYKQKLRTAQELFLGTINALDEVNQAIDAELKAEEKK